MRLPPLPNEIVVEILECVASMLTVADLSKLSLICKAWYPIAQSILLNSVMITPRNIARLFSAIGEHPHFYPLIRNLDSRNLRASSLEGFQSLRASSKVLSLTLRSHLIDEAQENIFVASFPHLQALSIKHGDIHSGFGSLARLIDSFPNLKSLTLENVHYDEGCRSTYHNVTMSLRSIHCCLGPRVMDELLQWLMSENSMSPIEYIFLGSVASAYGKLPNCMPLFLSRLRGVKSVWLKLSTMWDPPPLTFAENTQLEIIQFDFELWGFNLSKWVSFLSTVFSSITSVSVGTILIIIRMPGSCQPNFDWEDLGDILKSPTFASLRKISILYSRPHVAGEPLHLEQLEDDIRQAFAHLEAKGALTVR
ncbi:hypothetical protein PC9H_004360 [Pleurotus ostreatus]|uniref:F-box domain-containing protein n=1 Tax=Pleurotus ostreatus TaxID=5322 RepID=A0A8H7A049_PLEOS|nr:uncharacterized protein PC9H_004360 [Pleurotus ostreatus]KAF7437518.1 hypothetical protein PC9H_004360 [Pleurotus ostreatus]